MSATNMRMHVNDNGEYKTLHPETNSDQVLLTGGNTLQNHLNSFVPVKITDGSIHFLNPESGEYESYSSDSLALAPLGKITTLTGSSVNNKATIKWTDPSDVTIDTNIKSVTIAKWKGTKLVMKQGSIPVDENDGTLLIDSTIKNQYSIVGLQVNDLSFDSTYYFKVFPYTEAGVVTNSNDSVVTITPTLTKLPGVSVITTIDGGIDAYLFWTDPADVVQNGETLAAWAGTKVVMKEGTVAPTSPEDGTLLVDSKMRNQYSTSATAFKVTGLTSATNYRVAFFSYSTAGAMTAGASRNLRRTSKTVPLATAYSVSSNQGTATIKWSDPVNMTQDILGTTFTTAIWKSSTLVRKVGSYAANFDDGVKLIEVTERNKYATVGYNDINLTNGTTYYYTLFSFTTEGVATATTLGTTTIRINDDTSGSPGPVNLVAGTKTAGYYGYVPPEQFISGTQLSTQLGLTRGTSHNNAEGWLKFSIDGTTIFVAKKTFRYGLSRVHINDALALDGSKIIKIGSLQYKVRLIRGNAAEFTPFDNTKGSEWNRLMLPIHIEAKDKSWAFPQYVEDNVPDWGIGFTDADLGLHYNNGNGVHTWTQYLTSNNAYGSGVVRGYAGVSYTMGTGREEPGAAFGWRPVLELVQ